MKQNNLLTGWRKLVVAVGFSDAWIIRASDHNLLRLIFGGLSCLRRRLLSSLFDTMVEFQHWGGGAPALLRWPPIGTAPFNSPPSSTTPTHAVCAVDGHRREPLSAADAIVATFPCLLGLFKPSDAHGPSPVDKCLIAMSSAWRWLPRRYSPRNKFFVLGKAEPRLIIARSQF